MKRAVTLLCASLAIVFLLAITGCDSGPAPCDHQFGQLNPAVPADFFSEGSIAYYQCSSCGQLADAQQCPVESVATPKLSAGLSLCVNGRPMPLILDTQSSARITWTLKDLFLSQGDVLTLCDSADTNTAYAFSAQGNIGSDGAVITPAISASVTLTATPDGLTLDLGPDTYPGTVAQINGTRYPMEASGSGETTVYTYAYPQLQQGDRLLIIDNTTGAAYGYDCRSQEAQWNVFDYHGGTDGEFVFDHAGRYSLELSGGSVSIHKVFAPADGSAFNILFPEGSQSKAPMKEMAHQPDSALFARLLQFAEDERTVNGDDIADHITAKGLRAYSALLHLEEGTTFTVENASACLSLSGDHLTQVTADSDCCVVEGDAIRITTTGTYLIRYLPACDSITLEQLTIGGYKEAAKLLDRKIAATPSYLEQYYSSRIRELYECYQAFPDDIKWMFQTSPKIKNLYRNLQKLESDDSQVLYYINTPTTNNVYTSKAQLCNAFFTDFYYYIVVYHGTTHLELFDVRNADQFVALAKDFEGAEMSDLCGIGFACGDYLLEMRSNCILEDQTDQRFVGFCYQNGLYTELFPFFINYFAYWRLDEGYANEDNNGADFFADTWAATVDIAKFFYYDETTSYVRTERLLDCLTRSAGVVYGLDSSEPLPQITLRGYVFEGWYDNPEFTGSPLTALPDSGGTVRLYAKWSEDTQQRDKDAAATVDIYCYNLSTKRALITATTVGYVKQMYESLSDNAKAMVTQYSKAEGFIGYFTPQK